MQNDETTLEADTKLVEDALEIQSHYQDRMVDLSTDVFSDSSAARSVARRRGIGGRLRHIHTGHLWLQGRGSSWALS